MLARPQQSQTGWFVRTIFTLLVFFAPVGILSLTSLPVHAQVPTDSETDPAQDRAAASHTGQNAPSDAVRATLSRFGTFVPHAKYGEVWTPKGMPLGWHPYEACHWVNSKRYGWYFDDKRPWGEIVHHHGRWTRDPGLGWIWIPGAEWSPGWVVWRSSPQWIGWAPQLPDEDLIGFSSEDFNNGDTWTFMDVAKFNEGCSETQTVPASDVTTVLQQTQFVTEIDYVGGIAIFVLPTYVLGPPVDIEVTFAPWSPAFYFQLLLDIHSIFNDFDVAPAINSVDCTTPVSKPVLFSPALPPTTTTSPPVVSRPSPIVAPRLCPDGTFPPCRAPPQISCPRGSHSEGERCVANVIDRCPDGAPRDSFGSCRPAPPPFLCPNGAPPDRLTGSCTPAQTTQTCPSPLVLRNGLCVFPGPIQPPCPGGLPRDGRGQCLPQDAETCRPPAVLRNGACVFSGNATCPNGVPPDPRTGQCNQNVGVCAPPLFAMRDGRCIRVGGDNACPDGTRPDPQTGRCGSQTAGTCLLPKVLRNGACVDIGSPSGPPCPNGAPRDFRTGQCGPVADTCAPPRVMIDGRCTDRIVVQPTCPNGGPRDFRTGQCGPVADTCAPPRVMIDGRCTDRIVVQPTCPNGAPRDFRTGQCGPVANTCPPPRVMVGSVCTDRIVSQPACLPPRVSIDGRCTDRVTQPACAPPRTMRDGQCVFPVATPNCPSPMTMRDGRCVEPTPSRDNRLSDGRNPNGPFESSIRHPTYGGGQNGNFNNGVVQRPPALPVMPDRSGGRPIEVNRPPIVLNRGGGGQNVFNSSNNGPSRMAPQPTFNQMPRMGGGEGGFRR